MQEENTKENIFEKVKQEIDKTLTRIMEQGVQTTNIDFLGKMVDVKKDIAEIEKEEKEMMYGRGRNYNEGNYSTRGRSRDSRGRFMEGGSGSSYRGEELMDDMMYHYGNYNEGRERYGNDNETMKSFKYMLKSFKDYYKHLKQEASSQQEVQMLEDVAREISEM